MLEYQVNPNDSMFIRLQLGANDTGLYPQAKIYAIDAPTTVVDTINLDEIGSGLYGKIWTNNGIRTKYFTQTKVYTNAGHTNLHPIIRPDSDSINVGFQSSGGTFGSRRGGNVTQRVELTKEEIKMIAEEVLKLLKPELDVLNIELAKKSEFNPQVDIVKTDIVIPEMPEIHIPAQEKIDTALLVGQIRDIIEKNKVKIPESKDYSATLDKLLQVIDENKIDYSKFEELKDVMEDIVYRNKVEIPENKDYTKDFALLNATIGEMSLESQTKPIENILNLIEMNTDSLKIYKVFKDLETTDRETVFNFLLKNNPKLLRELADFSEADTILKTLNESKDKNAEFDRLKDKIKNLIPIIKRLSNV